MSNIRVNVLRLSGVACLLSVSACVTKVTDVTANKMGYLTKNFSAQSVNESVTKSLPKETASVEKFRELKITFALETDTGSGQKVSSGCLATYLPAGRGFVQVLSEYSKNDIPNLLTYEVRYGMLPLRWQSVPLQEISANPIRETKKISRFEPFPTRLGQKTIDEYVAGAIYDPVTDAPYQLICTATNVTQASKINPGLKGDAVEIECENRQNGTGTVFARTKWEMLSEYGIPVIVETKTASSKVQYRITDVNIEN